MAYPPRPPKTPIINPSLPRIHVMPPLGNSTTQQRSYHGAATISSQPTVYSRLPDSTPQYRGPIITVFVGNISERAPEGLIKRILSACGTVVNWKRVSTFGFCEFDGPTGGMRAVRLLSEMEIDGKKLVAKVDAKNKLILDNYKEDSKNEFNEAENGKVDESALQVMHSLLEEYTNDFPFDDIDVKKDIFGRGSKIKSCRSDDIQISKALQEANLEEEKRNLISSEIGKFRKRAEADDNRKEKDRKKRDDKDIKKVKDDNDSEQDWDKDEFGGVFNTERLSPRKDHDPQERRRRTKSESKERDRDRHYRERDRELREKERERERDKEREREREREKEKERERERERDREREHDEKLLKNVRDIQKEKEMEEELRERKKLEKKAREKEEAYQERLVNWELREKRKAKEYEKIRNKENLKFEEREIEAKRLKEFLEDYDDDRDDVKYYKTRELQRRLAERVREADIDVKDRNKEQEELEDLKNKIFSGEFKNPTQEYEKAKKEHENMYRPQILVDVNSENKPRKDREQKLLKMKKNCEKRQHINEEKSIILGKAESLESVSLECAESASNADDSHNSKQDSESGDFVSSHSKNIDSLSQSPSSAYVKTSVKNVSISSPAIAASFISLNLSANQRNKKIESNGVFNSDEDNDIGSSVKKRKLVPLDYEDNLLHQTTMRNIERDANKISGKTVPKKPIKCDTNQYNANKKQDKTQDEKRKHIKSIIDRIPTEKEDLFNYNLDRCEIDTALMEKKIRPWINKKIIEYIGEPEPTLVDFICSKVLAGSSPQSILDDVQMVLDEEAEVFVVKMWRLLIYEVDAKKVGLNK